MSSLAPPPLPRSTSSCSNRTAGSSSFDPFLSTSSFSMSTPTPASRAKPITPLLFVSVPEDPDEPSEVAYQRIFAQFVARMEEASDEDLSDANATAWLEGVDPTPGLMSWAESTRADLEDIKKQREAHIQAMYDQLEALWRRLGVSDADMDAFVESQRGSTEATVKAYEEELERMLELKRERMGTFVENARAEITKLWDELMVSAEEREDFAPFADDEHTEELLTIHEDEITRLKEERRLKGPLLTNIRKYFEICEDERELAAAASDQGRLLGRGPRDPGRLLREEKMRKRVTKEKPRLEQDLLVSIPTWESETGKVFLVHGESILQILMETVSAGDKENNNNKTKQGAGRFCPSRQDTIQCPFSVCANPHLGPQQSIATTHSVPSKQLRLGESTAAYNNAPRAPLSNSRGASSNRPPSPIRIAGKTPATISSLPRPVVAMPVPKLGTLQLGHGRVPSTRMNHGHNYHPYQAARARTASHTSSSYKHGAAPMNPSVVARKASRARRESFKPRPSVDETWAVGVGYSASDRRWAGAVKEEDEDF
ncbi:Anaphase spindle elongation protein 1 [Grifola frondosa]|uniref:Anaphase spindle elongation protein 1 n=1 Tax=Grifola frondosa TaxID=5627 RepID=A0A1C7MN39_GRIFR|nr:Anaphase spindle elongation protein 1 [Grifola frondosa]